MEEQLYTALEEEFQRYRSLGDRAIAQLTPNLLHRTLAPGDNSIAILVKHMAGNMKSRFTDFLTSDGEKPWRERDSEFTDPPTSIKELQSLWDSGWNLVFNALEEASDADAGTVVSIRGETHTLPEAFLRQLAHYALHTGQLVYLAKSLLGNKWKTLSIPRGGSDAYNRSMNFS